MSSTPTASGGPTTREEVPEVSLTMPCYNEEACIGETAPALVHAFQAAGIGLELVLVDNGSTDRTGEIIDEMIADGLPIRKIRIDVNRGYSDGIYRGLDAGRASIIGYLCADGQVAPEDVVRTYRLMANREERVLCKVRRRFRQDSWKRKIVSVIYNGLMQATFGWLGAIDINGSPKIFSRKNFEDMQLTSRDWFLDPEIILKAKAMGLRVIEIDVEGYARHGGTSNVRRSTILEFLKNIWRYRFGGVYRNWKKAYLAEHPPSSRSVVPSWSSAGPQQVAPDGTAAEVGPRPRDPSPDGGAASDRDGPVLVGAAHSPLDDVRVLVQKRFEDSRGYLHKVLAASQCDGRPPRGEVYVSAALPGEVKGNHYHLRMGEWFAVIEGRGSLELADPETGERTTIRVDASEPSSVYVPAGAAHALVNDGDGVLVCVAWAEAEHDPADVFPYEVRGPDPAANDVDANERELSSK